MEPVLLPHSDGRLFSYSLPLSLSTTRTKCQTLNERYIFGPRRRTLVLRLAQLAARRGDNRFEDALCAFIVRMVESQRSVEK